MEVIVVVIFLTVTAVILAFFAPNWWVGALVLLTFTSLPAFVPRQIELAGFGIHLHEIPLFLVACYLLIYKSANPSTDWCAIGVGAITISGMAYGLLVGHDIAATMNDTRGLLAMALCIFIVGRVSATPQAQIALQAVRISLWVSFPLIALAAQGSIQLGAHSQDAALQGAIFYGEANVTRILGPTTHLASATLAVAIALFTIRPDLVRTLLSYIVPALGVTIIAFSRNALVLVALTLLLTPVFHRSFSGAIRAASIAIVSVAVFLVMGGILSLSAGIPGFDYARLVYSAYYNRVLVGLGATAQEYDASTLYRRGEVNLLKYAIVGHEWFGRGFGFRYRAPVGEGFAATSGTYYAHHFYWWAVAKVGWCGLIAYLVTFVTPVVNALFGHGRFPLRSAAGAAVVGYLVTNTVVPLPETVYGAPALGMLLGIALLRGQLPGGKAVEYAAKPVRHPAPTC